MGFAHNRCSAVAPRRSTRPKHHQDRLSVDVWALHVSAGRGIDIERVNIVINYDFPEESDQYLHRVGRAGRFGTKGLAISFISSDTDESILKQVQERFAVAVPELPESIEQSSYM